MITLLSTLVGLLGAALPDAVRMFQDRADRKHELAILKLQMEQQDKGHVHRLEEIHTQADIAESNALYQTYHSGVTWVDALNGTVRPILAYVFFLVYATLKFALWLSLAQTATPERLLMLWGEEDHAIFVAIISFYFGQRAMRKARGL